MPLYSFKCSHDHISEMIVDMSCRDSVAPLCDLCERPTKRVHCEGRGLLFFEEGRGREDTGLGGPPITSWADRARRMQQQGVVEGNGVVPEGVRRSPKTRAMKRYLAKTQKGGWV